MTEPPEIVIPPRDWGDDGAAPTPPPTIVCSSRDGHGDPGPEWVPNRTAPWRGVAKRAGAAGWAVRITYALAWVPDAYWLHAGLRKAAHYVHTIAVRLSKGAERAVAVWRRETADVGMPGAGWSCDMAAVGPRFIGLSEWKAAVIP